MARGNPGDRFFEYREIPPWVPLAERGPIEDPPYEFPLDPGTQPRQSLDLALEEGREAPTGLGPGHEILRP